MIEPATDADLLEAVWRVADYLGPSDPLGVFAARLARAFPEHPGHYRAAARLLLADDDPDDPTAPGGLEHLGANRAVPVSNPQR